MKIRVQDGLPYVSVTLTYRGQHLTLPDVVLDTGSAGTVLPIEAVASIGLLPEPQDTLQDILGIGGTEVVLMKQVDHLAVGELAVGSFRVELGSMQYGFKIDGIIGMDFLTQVGAIIDVAKLELHQ